MNPLLVSPQARAAPKKGCLYLYDAIGDDGMGGGITAIQVVDALKELKASGHKELEVRISSPGGSVFDGIAMYRAISEWDGPKVAIVDGLAASAASFVMLAADKVQAGAEAMIMVHEAWGGLFAAGTADEIVAAAEALAAPLRKANDSIVAIYVQRTGLDEKKCRSLMAAETWMTGAERRPTGSCPRCSRTSAPRSGLRPTPPPRSSPSSGTRPRPSRRWGVLPWPTASGCASSVTELRRQARAKVKHRRVAVWK